MKNKVIIIAEAGVNHNGDINLAKKLIDAAVEAGVDYVKFQTFKTENLVSKNAKKAEYQIQKTDASESQFEMIKKLELSEDQHLELKKYCKQKGITFLSTAFDLESVDFLKKLEIPFWKIPSGEITNLPYLEKIGQLGKPIILSTGMCNMQEIEHAIAVLQNQGVPKSKISVLHCNTEYPTPMQDVNLNAMQTMAQALNVKVGYSDHTLGIEIPIAAVALGALIIEKHFTLDKNMHGPDHAASLEPNELKAMVIAIRNIELALGNGIKTASNSELKNITIARKSIHLKNALSKGDIIQLSDLIMKRPGDGISPMDYEKVISKEIISHSPINYQLKLSDLK